MHHIAFNRGRPCALAPAAVLLLGLCLLAAGVQALTDSPALVIDGPGLYSLDHDLSPDSSIGVLINSSDVVFDGMGHSITGTDADTSFGVVVGRISPEPRVVNVTVRNLTVRHWRSGIFVMRANGSVVEHVIAEQNGIGLDHGGPEFFPSENGVVRDSVFRNNTGVGIALGYPSGGITVERCRVTGNGGGMVVASGPGTYDTYRGSPSLVADCDISGNQGYGLQIQEDGYSFRHGLVSAVRNCTIRGNGGDGVVVTRSTTTIIGNRVEENGGYGVNAGDDGGSDITSNWIAGNRYGVSAGGDWPSHVRNNVLNNTDNGIFGVPPDNSYLTYTKTAGTNIVGGPYLGGNYWAFPNGTGFSQTHPDTDGDGFCDEAYFLNEDTSDALPLALTNVPPIGGDVGYFLVSTAPAGAEVSLVDISGTRYPKGNTSAGPLNISVYLTATPIRQIVANLSGYRDAVYTITQDPAKGQTVPVSLTLEPAGPKPYTPLSVPGRIQGEDYDLGGEGVAYHDTTPGNSGGVYRTDGVDIESIGGVTNVGWIRNGEFLTYTAKIAEAGAYTMQARVASPNSGRTATVSVDGVQTATIAVPNTGSFATFRTIEVPVTLPAGTHTLKLAFAGDGQNLDWVAFAPIGVTTPIPTPTPTPYVSVINIPGTIQAEDYNLGGEGVAYHDTTAGNSGGAYRQDGVDVAPIAGGHAVVGIEDGEWLTYSIGGVSSTPQLPALVLYLGSNRDGGSVQVEVNGRIAGNVSVPNTGSPTAFRAVQTQVVAAEGTLRLRFHGSGMGMDRIESPVMTSTGDDYNWANFTADPVNGTAPLTVRFTDTSSEFAYEWQWDFGDGTTSTEQNPIHTFQRPGAYSISLNIKEADHWSFGGYIHIWNDLYHGKAMQLTVEETGPAQGHVIPGTIQSEDYNLGGEGVAYHDTTPGNSGGAYRTDGVDIESIGGVTNVGWIRNGEFLTYTAKIAEAGAYTMQARVASPNSGRTATVSVDGVQKATIAVPNTGSFSTFRTVEAPVTLPAGTHTLKLAFSGDGQNLDWVAFAPVGVTTPTPTPTTTPTAGGASFTAAPATAPKGSAVKFSLTPAAGKAIRSAWWSFDAPAHLNTWNSRNVNPTFYYPAKGTFSPLVKLTYTDGSSETVQRANYVRAT